MTKNTTKKTAAKKVNPLDEFAAAVEKARKAGIVVKASIALTDDDGNTEERSF